MAKDVKEQKDPKSIKLNKEQTVSLYRYKEEELRRISSRLNEVENILMDINKAERTIKEIQNVKAKEKIMINIGAGVLVPCEIENTDSVKVILPGSIIITKDMKGILEDFSKRKANLEDARKKLIESYQNNVKTLESIQQAFQKMSEKQNTNNTANVN